MNLLPQHRFKLQLIFSCATVKLFKDSSNDTFKKDWFLGNNFTKQVLCFKKLISKDRNPQSQHQKNPCINRKSKCKL